MKSSRRLWCIPLNSDTPTLWLCYIRLFLVCILTLPASSRIFQYLRTHPDVVFQDIHGLANTAFGLFLLSLFLVFLEYIPYHLLRRLFPPEENALWTGSGRKAKFLILSAALGSLLQLTIAIAGLVAAVNLAGTWQQDPEICRYLSEKANSPSTWLQDDPEKGYAEKVQRAVGDIPKYATILMALSSVGAVTALSTLLLLRVLPTRWRLPAASSPFAESLATEVTVRPGPVADMSGVSGACRIAGAHGRLSTAYNNLPPRRPLHIAEPNRRGENHFPRFAAANGGLFQVGHQPAAMRASGVSALFYDPAFEYWTFGMANRYHGHISILLVWQLPQAVVQLVRFGILWRQDQLKLCTQYCALSVAPMYIWVPVVLVVLLMIRRRVPFQKPLLWRASFENILVAMTALACATSLAALASLGIYVFGQKDDRPEPPDPVFPNILAFVMYAVCVSMLPVFSLPCMLCGCFLRKPSWGPRPKSSAKQTSRPPATLQSRQLLGHL